MCVSVHPLLTISLCLSIGCVVVLSVVIVCLFLLYIVYMFVYCLSSLLFVCLLFGMLSGIHIHCY